MEQEITMKNTKAEMLEALNAALARAETAELGKLNPMKAEKEKVEKKAVESAKSAVEQNIFSVELKLGMTKKRPEKRPLPRKKNLHNLSSQIPGLKPNIQKH